jgi:hypothetical protein
MGLFGISEVLLNLDSPENRIILKTGISHPISCGALVVAALLILSALLPWLQKKRKAAITEEP